MCFDAGLLIIHVHAKLVGMLCRTNIQRSLRPGSLDEPIILVRKFALLLNLFPLISWITLHHKLILLWVQSIHIRAVSCMTAAEQI